MEEPKPGEIYRHFKGGIYEIIELEIDADFDEGRKRVAYRSIFDSEKYPKETRFSRSLEDFLGFKEINGKKIKRFIKLT